MNLNWSEMPKADFLGHGSFENIHDTIYKMVRVPVKTELPVLLP